VDDNADAAESLLELLRLWEYEACMVHDGASALAEARTFRPVVILLDIGLPDLDGYEVAVRLRQQGWGGGMLVALTGFGQDEDRKRAEDAGFDRHLTKPVEPNTLLALLMGES
jgi:CheY-like chemotaxis protein